MNVDFIEVCNDKSYYDEEISDLDIMICRELLRIDSIQHIYIMLPEEKAICFEYRNEYTGRNSFVIESFPSKVRCAARFNELSRLLSKGE